MQFPLRLIFTEILERKGLRGIKSLSKIGKYLVMTNKFMEWCLYLWMHIHAQALSFPHIPSSPLPLSPLSSFTFSCPTLLHLVTLSFLIYPSITVFMNVCMYPSIHPSSNYPSSPYTYLKIITTVKHNSKFWLINLSWKFA